MRIFFCREKLQSQNWMHITFFLIIVNTRKPEQVRERQWKYSHNAKALFRFFNTFRKFFWNTRRGLSAPYKNVLERQIPKVVTSIQKRRLPFHFSLCFNSLFCCYSGFDLRLRNYIAVDFLLRLSNDLLIFHVKASTSRL